MMFLVSCKQQEHIESFDSEESNVVITRQEPKSVSYHLENTKQWLSAHTDYKMLNIAYAINRTDSTNLKQMDSILIPGDMNGDIEFYLPFPLTVSYLKDKKKSSFFLIQHRYLPHMKRTIEICRTHKYGE
jgi:hypothetical protein